MGTSTSKIESPRKVDISKIHPVKEKEQSVNHVELPQIQITPCKPKPDKEEKKVQYVQTKMLGYGTSGRVYECIDVNTSKTYAMKIIQLSAKTKEQAVKEIQNLKREIGLLKRLSHPNIVGYYHFEVNEQKRRVQIVLQKVTPGNLRDIVKERAYGEGEAARMTKQILEGLKYLHKEGIIHRDLKGANILVNEDQVAKIADFGTAKLIVGQDTKTRENIAVTSNSLRGTPYWMAPEVLKRTGHSFSADIWSLGCTVIEMLTGAPPWSSISQNFQEIIRFVTTGMQPPFPEEASKNCKHFLNCCLDPNPNKRLSANELLNHKWIRQSTGKQPKGKQLMIEDIESHVYPPAPTVHQISRLCPRQSNKGYKKIRINQTPKASNSKTTIINDPSKSSTATLRPNTSACQNIIIETWITKKEREEQERSRYQLQKQRLQSRKRWEEELKAALERKN